MQRKQFEHVMVNVTGILSLVFMFHGVSLRSDHRAGALWAPQVPPHRPSGKSAGGRGGHTR